MPPPPPSEVVTRFVQPLSLIMIMSFLSIVGYGGSVGLRLGIPAASIASTISLQFIAAKSLPQASVPTMHVYVCVCVSYIHARACMWCGDGVGIGAVCV